jgi:ATP-dependent DNA helicase RecQ
MAAFRPRTRDALAQVSGVGARKLDSYGEAFLAVLNAFEPE